MTIPRRLTPQKQTRRMQEEIRRLRIRPTPTTSVTPWVAMHDFLDVGWRSGDPTYYGTEYPALMICRDDHFAYITGTITWNQREAIHPDDYDGYHPDDTYHTSVNVGATSGGINIFFSNSGLDEYAMGRYQQIDMTLLSTAYQGYGPQGSLDISIWPGFSRDSVAMFTTGGYFHSAYQDDGVTPATGYPVSNAAWHEGSDFPQHRVSYGINAMWRLASAS